MFTVGRGEGFSLSLPGGRSCVKGKDVRVEQTACELLERLIDSIVFLFFFCLPKANTEMLCVSQRGWTSLFCPISPLYRLNSPTQRADRADSPLCITVLYFFFSPHHVENKLLNTK